METQLIQLLANTISLLTVLSCLFLKVPQILYLRKKQSADGIYIQAMLMEITGFTIVTLYNYTNQYSVMTYLEYPIILLQIYVLLYYVLKFKGYLSAPVVPLLITAYFAAVLSFVVGILPREILSYLVPLCTPLSGSAKVTYIYGIIKAANADAVSLTTWIISVLTNISRLFTVYVDSADTKLMINFIVSTTLSAGVLATALYYQSYSTKPKPQKQGRRQSLSDDKNHLHKE
ncbi:solute carrier family 66 member 3 [Vanessa cardui]|uniref:solute carrier family 66 member 3 n=1 Tax=Vanessa cardui TaxID=171605 RepID=UPI001F12C2CF|nr:solute carrier family 66 member 3 [Vanessa cardui]XP_046977268.1 solute carrier family 66 member 3 [Vanessa cardui]XP_046977269.1 solute carrier family 66 member 3 [Vanessa cardui]